MQKVLTIEESSNSDFEKMVNAFLEDGYKISSTSCGFANSENYDFAGRWQAILVKEV